MLVSVILGLVNIGEVKLDGLGCVTLSYFRIGCVRLPWVNIS
jgi:hypothetical protein